MRRENLYLSDIVEATDAIEHFVAGVTSEEFTANDLIRSAVLQKLIVIGEAAARLPQPFRDRHPDVQWADVAAFRNVAVHAYFRVDWDIVWMTVTQDVPALRESVVRILAEQVEES